MSEHRGQPERIAVGFAQALRAAGVAVPLGSVLVFVEALGWVGIDQRGPVYWAGRATLIRRPEDQAVYDRVFAAYWLDQRGAAGLAVARSAIMVADGSSDSDSGTAEALERPTAVARYSPAEVLAHRDFAQLSQEEWTQAGRLIAGLRTTAEERRVRRLRAARRPGGRLYVRGTVRHALRSGGEPIRIARRSRTARPRRLVLLLDVSGSMHSYVRALLRFAHAAMCARGGLQVEAFTLGTRLTRTTKELSWRDADLALSAVSNSVRDWSGGTRLGQSLREFNDRWGARGMARGAVVVVLSDGWDRGNPVVLGAEVARLHRLAHRVIWVNPLKASPDFAPLAGGMAAALPWVDDFVDGHSVAALEELAAVIGGNPTRGPYRARRARP